jgi:aryl-alcohol dehydrogenase-like predicted oxidoreductase
VKQRTVGRSGLRVSRIGLGTRGWGTLTNGEEAATQLMAFADAGGTLVDTSPAYGNGAAQRILAELLDDVVPREALVLSGSAGVVVDSHGPAGVDTSRRALLGQLDRTLREFGTDHLDIFSVAAWDEHTPVDEVAHVLEHAVTSGKARYCGAHGFTGWQLAALASKTAVAAGQVPYSVLDRGVEAEFLPAARHYGIGVLAAAPLSGGILTGKYRDGLPADSRGADAAHAAEIRAALDERAARVAEAIVTAADGLATSPLSVALAWVRDRPAVASAVVGARDVAQLTGVLATESLELPRAIDDALDDVSA